MVRLLERIEVAGPSGYQLRAMLEVLYSSGVRIAELLGMDLDAVDSANATARVHGKGDKWRMVPLGRTAVRFMEGYVTGVRTLQVREPEERAIWLGRDGHRLKYHVFRRQLAELVRDAGLPVVVTAHTFRHPAPRNSSAAAPIAGTSKTSSAMKTSRRSNTTPA